MRIIFCSECGLRLPVDASLEDPRCPDCVRDELQLYVRQTTERPVLREIEPGHRVACHVVAGDES